MLVILSAEKNRAKEGDYHFFSHYSRHFELKSGNMNREPAGGGGTGGGVGAQSNQSAIQTHDNLL